MEFIEEGEFLSLVHKLCAAHKREISFLHEKIRFLHSKEGKKIFHGHQDHCQSEATHQEEHHHMPQSAEITEIMEVTHQLTDDKTGAQVAPHHHNTPHRTPWHHDSKAGQSKSNLFVNNQSITSNWDSKTICQRLKKIIHHPIFDCLMSGLIVINAAMFAFEAQYRGFELAQRLGISEDSALRLWPGAVDVFEVAELIFGIVFTVEVFIKICVDRLKFFRDGWNWLDFIVVLVWIFGKTGTSLPVNSQILRLGRLFRLLRMLRLVRQMKEFDALFLMTTAIRSSFMVLGWTIILLLMCQMLCALVIQQTLFGFYFDPTHQETLQDQRDVFVYFGTFTRSLLTLFEMTLANWPPVASLLAENVSEFWMPVCLIHKLTMGFAVVGVINGVLMQETFKVAHMDDNVMVREKQRAMRAHLAKMSLLFEEADTSGDGRLDLEEFKNILDDYEIKIWLAAMDLDVSDVEELFHLLDDGGDGRLSAEELVRGVAKLRGAARAMDLRKIHQMSSDVHADIKHLHAKTFTQLPVPGKNADTDDVVEL